MHSSISSSDSRPARNGRHISLVIIMLLSFLMLLEIATRSGFRRISRVESRVAKEYEGATSISSNEDTLLLLGNSLLLNGMDYPAVQQALQPRVKVRRFVIEDTTYFDWYYGIRHLLAEGARPKRIYLCLNANQLLRRSIRGEYSSYYLLSTRDLADLRGNLDYDLTQTSGLLLARYSLFYAGRNNIRNFVMNRLAPRYGAIMGQIAAAPRAELPASDELEREAAIRLRALNAAVAPYGVPFTFIVPPGIPGDKEIVAAGRSANVDVMVPIAPTQLPSDFYSDGLHLNEKGARCFSAALAKELRTRLPIAQ